MKKLAAIIGGIILVLVAWELYNDPQIKFSVMTRYKAMSQGATIDMWGPNCWIRFDYCVSTPAESERKSRFIKYLKETLPPIEGGWRAVVVAKLGDTYEIHLPIKKGVENDFFWLISMRSTADELSTKMFDAKPVEWHLCDLSFNTIRVVTQ